MSGQLKASDNFPSERELREEFGVSTITIRQALKILENEGLIRREQGRGTFITEQDHNKLYIEWSGSVHDFFNPAGQHKPVITSKTIIRADSQTAMEMGLQEGEELYLLEGTQRLFTDKPQGLYLKAYFPKEIGEKIPVEELKGRLFITALQISSEELTQIIQAMSATTATKKIAAIMKLQEGSPILINKLTFISKKHHVVGIAIWHIPGDIFQFVNKLRYRKPRY
ncbi:MAG: GntR family transcriptional regulator [Deltaproteobacteria bacterium]|nr:GntR family transcriptional regulator [Deltaproteobacteria bacterium]